MSKVKISVIKKFSPKEILGYEFIRPNGKPIPICSFEIGEEFIVDETGNMPENFCHHAWFGLYKNVQVLNYGGGFPDWTGEGTIYNACPDGLRPVIFKLERMEE
ncbi:MAG: TIGR04076 family protein [Candidatus Heimdallarchaeota archaeon]|nr:TIGR04076 family protein [Candidatus Heimdallarchaeota archaeon]MCK5143019.1 TIGR04076 family protein [Candidatus Heimdallarchaeota archaeon]